MAMTPKPLRTPHRVQIVLRYVLYLCWEFRWSLGIFWMLVLGGGLLLHLNYHDPSANRLLPFGEACYAVFMLIFLESTLPFPREWYLQPLFFLLPVIGLAAVADSLIRLGYLMFSRKQRLPEWHRMVASLYSNHIIVVGLGKVGYAILKELLAFREPVVGIEKQDADSALLEEVIDLKVPVLRGDGRTRKILEQAGIKRAKAIVLATSDDLTNLDAGLTAHDLNPKARIVLRLFDDSLAAKVHGAFALPAISTSRVAAPAFVAAATGRRVYQEFQLAGRELHIIDLTVRPDGTLKGTTVGEIQADRVVNIVMHSGPLGPNVNPGPEVVLNSGDEILVIAPKEKLSELETMNEPANRPIP